MFHRYFQGDPLAYTTIGTFYGPFPSLDSVQLEFAPKGRSEVVLAVDAIDAGSVRGLIIGEEVRVSSGDVVAVPRLHATFSYNAFPVAIHA